MRVPRLLAAATIQGGVHFVQELQIVRYYSRAACIRRNAVHVMAPNFFSFRIVTLVGRKERYGLLRCPPTRSTLTKSTQCNIQAY